MSLVLTSRQLCDLEMILNGGFSPLKGFLGKEDYFSVLNNMRLSTGELWPMPIVLPIKKEKVKEMVENFQDNNNTELVLTLLNEENLPLGKIINPEFYNPDLELECQQVFKSLDTNHPYIKDTLSQSDIYYVGGNVIEMNPFPHFDFKEHRLTPDQTKKYFKEHGWKTIVGFQTRNPMHRSHYELTKYALNKAGSDAKLLLHPVVGVTQSCDVNYHTRVRCYKKLLNHYEPNSALLSLLPISMRMAGPREALWHALIRQNYGCTHFVVGRDHAGPSYKKQDGSDFFGPFDAHELLESVEDELNIKVIKSQWIVYAKNLDTYKPMDQVTDEDEILHISGTKQRELLNKGLPIPSWFTFPDIEQELRKSYKPVNEQGFCVYFIGLSGSGKSTVMNALKAKLMALDSRHITTLDGDVVRQHLSKGLGFNKNDRSTNVRRIGWIASEIVKHNGIVMTANIAPYKADRDYNRDLIGKNYIEVFVDTPLEECEKRDCKGLYKLARQGVIKEFTGISDPFEHPEEPEVLVKLDNIENQVNKVLSYLQDKGLVKDDRLF
tara:strand:+ start:1758 stop:3410 length:1653 start_codon:yes stop_codon:yes gene_type:complete